VEVEAPSLIETSSSASVQLTESWLNLPMLLAVKHAQLASLEDQEKIQYMNVSLVKKRVRYTMSILFPSKAGSVPVTRPEDTSKQETNATCNQ